MGHSAVDFEVYSQVQRSPSARLCTMSKVRHSSSNKKAESFWADVSPDVFAQILSRLKVSCKMRCEEVCASWRKALRQCPAPGLWGAVLELADNQANRNLDAWLMPNDFLILPAAGSLHSEQLVSCGSWLQRRAMGFLTVKFGGEKYRGIQLGAPGNADMLSVLLQMLDKASQLPCVEVYARGEHWAMSSQKALNLKAQTFLMPCQFDRSVQWSSVCFS